MSKHINELEPTEGQEAYIEAIYNLSQAIVAGNDELLRLQQFAMRHPLDISAQDRMWRKHADILNTFTQKYIRGGLN